MDITNVNTKHKRKKKIKTKKKGCTHLYKTLIPNSKYKSLPKKKKGYVVVM